MEIPESALEALDYLVKVAESEELRYDFRVEAGECIFANNLLHMHARAAFGKEVDEQRKRHLLRAWIDCDPGFRPVTPQARVFEHGVGISAHPELVHQAGRAHLEEGA